MYCSVPQGRAVSLTNPAIADYVRLSTLKVCFTSGTGPKSWLLLTVAVDPERTFALQDVTVANPLNFFRMNRQDLLFGKRMMGPGTRLVGY